MRYTWRVTLALIVSFGLLLWPWTQLTRDTGGLLGSFLAAAAVLLAGALTERLGPVPRVPIQIVVGAVGVAATLAFSFGADVLADLPGALTHGWVFIQSASAPVAANPGVTLIVATSAALLALLAYGLAVPSRQPALGVLPLICLYLVPSVILVTPMLFTEFLLLAASVVAVLWAGSALPRGEFATRAAALLTTVGIGIVAVALTFAVAQAFPQLEPRRSQEPLQMNDPSLDLKRNLVEGTDDVILSYRTDAPDGAYLKLATLPAFSREGFALADVRVGSGRFPAVPGGPSGERRTTQVAVGAFRSEWLPVPYAPERIDAPGDWGFALDTLDVMALNRTNRAAATEGISYTVTSLDVSPSAGAIAGASANDAPRRELNTNSAGVPPSIRTLAEQVTEGRGTAGAKAQALEAYLRSDRFTYSTAPAVGVGDGIATIEDFLFRSHRGYCEQFAGAMTLMARTLGIPARMAVGFVPGTRVGDAWEVTARDMHTWPEIWLDGQGWVAFEPTPSRGDAAGTDPTSAPTSTAQPTEQVTASAEPTPEEQPSEEPQPEEQGAGEEASLLGLLPWLLVAALVIAGGVVVARLLPGWRRTRRRERRLAGTGDPRADTVAAWDEVRDSAADLRLPWPDGSPRFAAERLASRFGDDEEALAALRRLAAATERALFDRSETYDLPGGWRDEVTAVVAALTTAAEARKDARPRRVA